MRRLEILKPGHKQPEIEKTGNEKNAVPENKKTGTRASGDGETEARSRKNNMLSRGQGMTGRPAFLLISALIFAGAACPAHAQAFGARQPEEIAAEEAEQAIRKIISEQKAEEFRAAEPAEAASELIGAKEETGPKISDTAVILYLKEGGITEKQLTVSGIPEGAVLAWNSKDPSIVTVDKNGRIASAGAGKTTVVCTVALPDGSVRTLKTSVRVRDNIRELTLELEENVRPNALRTSVGYQLYYTCRTVAGTDKNTSNVIYYEVLTPKGAVSVNASVTDGVFLASRCAPYVVKAYAFETENAMKKWLTDRKKYEGNVLASDSLSLTVTLENFRTEKRVLSGWELELPPSYQVKEEEGEDGSVLFGVSALNSDKLTAASNIRIMVDKLEDAPDFEELERTMKLVYTRKMLQNSWKSVYHAETAKITDFSLETVRLGARDVVRLDYEIELKNIRLTFEEAADIEISRLTFRNAIYTWYEGSEHVTVNVTDAMESLQPNISDAAEKLVKSMRPAK